MIIRIWVPQVPGFGTWVPVNPETQSAASASRSVPGSLPTVCHPEQSWARARASPTQSKDLYFNARQPYAASSTFTVIFRPSAAAMFTSASGEDRDIRPPSIRGAITSQRQTVKKTNCLSERVHPKELSSSVTKTILQAICLQPLAATPIFHLITPLFAILEQSKSPKKLFRRSSVLSQKFAS